MQDLRLIGVHADGLHVLLADAEGNSYRLPLDESLRAAARSDRPRLGQLQIEMAGGLRPKDVQAMVRAGLTAEEVAARAGWTVEKVHRYEGPILAEREHVAGLARQVRLRARGAGQPSGSPTLEHRVDERMRAREIDPDTAEWDSHRSHQGQWTVVVRFNAGGRQRQAAWDFDLLAKVVSARDDEARWLSEDEDITSTGPIPAPHLSASARPTRVYDVEADGGVASSTSHRSADTLDLMEAMRERSSQRGRRRRNRAAEVPGIDQAPEQALPLEELGRPHPDEPPPAAHPHPRDDPTATPTPAPTQTPAPTPNPEAKRGRGGATRRATADKVPDDAGNHPAAELESAAPLTSEQLQDEQRGPAGGPARPPAGPPLAEGPAAEAPAPEDDGADDPPADEVSETKTRPVPRRPASRASTRKSGRPSVPSWDDIVFGRKPD